MGDTENTCEQSIWAGTNGKKAMFMMANKIEEISKRKNSTIYCGIWLSKKRHKKQEDECPRYDSFIPYQGNCHHEWFAKFTLKAVRPHIWLELTPGNNGKGFFFMDIPGGLFRVVGS